MVRQRTQPADSISLQTYQAGLQIASAGTAGTNASGRGEPEIEDGTPKAIEVGDAPEGA